MNQSSVEKVLAMWKLARYDPKCSAVGKKYDKMEEAFSRFAAGLSKEDQDVVWGFVTTSDELDFCVMELMCDIFNIDPAEYLEKLKAGCVDQDAQSTHLVGGVMTPPYEKGVR